LNDTSYQINRVVWCSVRSLSKMAANKFAASHVSLKLAWIERNSEESLKRFLLQLRLNFIVEAAFVIAIKRLTW